MTKGLLRWCRYYYLLNPLINTVIHKLSEYPITDITYEEEDDNVRERWTNLLQEDLNYRSFQIESGLDYFTYGIAIVTLYFPFVKYLICRNCKHKVKAKDVKYKWRQCNYVLACKKCGHEGPALVQDSNVRDARRIRLIRWNPEHISIDQGFPGSDPVYLYQLPESLKADLVIGRKQITDTIPDVFVEAMKRNKMVRFSPDNVFVFKREIISQKDSGWGMPLILPVFRDAFYLQILRKAQEAIAQSYLTPLRVIFPAVNSGTSDPYNSVDLHSWRSRIESELAKHTWDPNYRPILPIPIGSQTIGGDGKALLLYQEMQAWSDQIIMGMGVPLEFVRGGLSFSGSNVSLRMVENFFLGYRSKHDAMLNRFVIPRIASYMKWRPTKAHMRRFKMADDLQRTAYYYQLNQAGKISDQTLLQESDQDPAVEQKLREKELERQLAYTRKMQLAQAAISGEVMISQAKYQLEATKMQAEAQNMLAASQNPMQQMGPGGQDPAAQDPTGQGQPGGQEGEMMPGPEMDPGMPEGSTVSPENAQHAMREGAPEDMLVNQGSPDQQQGNLNLAYLAGRAARTLEQMQEGQRQAELEKMKAMNPRLYQHVLRILLSRKGSQQDPLDPLQSPLPQQRPTRRAAPVGV
jgi:hypothetical protein